MSTVGVARARVIVVGVGRISPFWFPPLMRQPDVEVVRVVDADVRGATERLAALGVDCTVTASLPEALAETDADLVVNLTPVEAHRQVIETAFAAGCDVFTEKPLTTTLDEALELVDLAARTGRTLGVMQNRRNTVQSRRIRAEIEAGTIGTPSAYSAELTMFLEPTAVVARKPHPMLQEMTIHVFDQARYYAGEDPVAVIAHEFSPPGTSYGGPAAAVCVWELPSGGAFVFNGNWGAPGHASTFNGRWRISGTLGTVFWDSSSDPVAEFESGRRAFGEIPPPRREVWTTAQVDDLLGHAASIDEFFEARRAGRPPRVDGRDNLRSLAMVAAALRSAAERRWVTIDEVLSDAAAGGRVACA
jgi:predicted dehydrogenase